MPPEDEDLYELSEDDAVEPAASTGEVRPSSEKIEQLDDDGQTYALGDEVVPPPRRDTAILERPPRYCLACNADLTLVDDGVCPDCERAFDPADPKTLRDEPLTDEKNWWLQPPRVAGYGLIAMFLVGRLIIDAASGAVAEGLAGGTGDTRSSAMIGAVVSALGVLLVTPWVFFGTLLGLTGVCEHFNPRLIIAVPIGAGFGLLLTLGLHPAVIFVGFMIGSLAGFFYAWRQV
ncbi:MAG: hypothetical protein AAF333_05705 [Planctomycetota bacterium]